MLLISKEMGSAQQPVGGGEGVCPVQAKGLYSMRRLRQNFFRKAIKA